ncbi:Tkl protein kinase, partial [Globisporangium polare]
MDNLTELYVYCNEVSSFTAVFSSLQHLQLGDNKLEIVPASIPKHTKLLRLYLGGNSIKTFTQSDVAESLETLYLNGNNISTFDAVLPNLRILSLETNSLRAFPTSIFSHKTLSELLIHGNSEMQNVSFTQEQVDFLSNLTKFQVDAASLQSNCETQVTVGQYNVCLTTAASATVPMLSPPASSNVTTPESSSPTSLITGGVIGGLVVVGLAIAYFVRKSQKNKSRGKVTTTESVTAPSVGKSFDGDNGATLSLWNDRDLLALKVSVNDIQDVEKIGSGAFADVWLIEFCKSQLMASKRLRSDVVTRERTQAFIEEIKLVSKLKHPNIVELMGAAWVRETDLQALFEYMDNGDLRTYLMNPRIPTQWSSDKLQIAIDVAEALVYVHSFMPPLVHRDLKSR